ncbi:uncharacterized protein LOC112694471 [Sipha flava]|uniref:Uncharacterized protein LOC112694471 n=1 Tax=Sipha flava TaxID=143950 RepID=A0A8B8GRQ5_9HEMI|nr:uncharacterized protein LOC112694471 [Sipha flava]
MRDTEAAGAAATTYLCVNNDSAVANIRLSCRYHRYSLHHFPRPPKQYRDIAYRERACPSHFPPDNTVGSLLQSKYDSQVHYQTAKSVFVENPLCVLLWSGGRRVRLETIFRIVGFRTSRKNQGRMNPNIKNTQAVRPGGPLTGNVSKILAFVGLGWFASMILSRYVIKPLKRKAQMKENEELMDFLYEEQLKQNSTQKKFEI